MNVLKKMKYILVIAKKIALLNKKEHVCFNNDHKTTKTFSRNKEQQVHNHLFKQIIIFYRTDVFKPNKNRYNTTDTNLKDI
jgi:hypothetical protein